MGTSRRVWLSGKSNLLDDFRSTPRYQISKAAQIGGRACVATGVIRLVKSEEKVLGDD